MCAFHRLVDCIVQGSALAERVQRTGLDERLDYARVHDAEVDFLAELPEALETAADFIAGLDDGFDGVAADVLYRGQTEADGISMGGELCAGNLHVGRLDCDAHLLTLADVLDDVLGLRGFGRQQRGHELDRIVGLEIGRVVCHERIGCGVRFVESVS